MIGIIISGHGNFATGLRSSLNGEVNRVVEGVTLYKYNCK